MLSRLEELYDIGLKPVVAGVSSFGVIGCKVCGEWEYMLVCDEREGSDGTVRGGRAERG